MEEVVNKMVVEETCRHKEEEEIYTHMVESVKEMAVE